MFILDTNVVSELRKSKSGRADQHVTAWAASVDANELHLAAITVQELETGVLMMERRDAQQGAMLRLWLESQVWPTFEGRILAFDKRVAIQCARLHVPDPKSDRDSLIAATALVHAMIVVTRNVEDFTQTGCAILNPWLPR